MTTVDMHTHFVSESWPDLADRFGTPDWPWMRHTSPGKAMKAWLPFYSTVPAKTSRFWYTRRICLGASVCAGTC
jgi:hypothetical protein